MPVTQREIARQAGVTQKTVSLFFSGSPHIAPNTREKIKEVSDRLGYFPNQAAISIRSKEFKRIALVVVQRRVKDYPNNPHLISYINTAARELAELGYSLVHEPFYVNTQNHDLDETPNFFKALYVDGIIGVAGTYVPASVDEVISSMGPPVVWLNRLNSPEGVPHIDIDEQLNGDIVGEYIKKRGFRSIAWFGPDFEHDIEWHYSAKVRYERIRRLCEEAGIEVKPYFARIGENLYDASARIFSDSLPQALIGYNMDYADSAQYRMMESGIKHPSDVEIIRFASSWELHTGISSKYTMLVLPERELSTNGVKYIMSTLKKKKDTKLLAPLPGELVERKA